MFSKFERFFKSIKNTRNEMPKKQLAPFIYFATSPKKAMACLTTKTTTTTEVLEKENTHKMNVFFG